MSVLHYMGHVVQHRADADTEQHRADMATNQRWHEFYTLDGSNSNKPLFGKQEPALYVRYVVSGLSMPALSQECTLQYPEVGSNEEQNILLLYLKFSGGCTSLEYLFF